MEHMKNAIFYSCFHAKKKKNNNNKSSLEPLSVARGQKLVA